MKKSVITFFIAFVVVYAAAFFGSAYSTIGSWYANLHKPLATPPDFVFGIVWPILYTLIAISFWLFMRKVSKEQIHIFGWITFITQLALNILWPIFFFQFQAVCPTVYVLFLLIAVVLCNIFFFYRASKISGLLLVPYLLWIIFAGYLNLMICNLN